MRVFVTAELQSYWESRGNTVATLCNAFREWKSDWPRHEHNSFLFGKDGAYDAPLIDGKRLLRHVHLVPLLDLQARKKRYQRFSRASRKTSDRALVYASDGYDCHVLIYILDEPDAHRVAQMKTVEDIQTMEGFAATAIEFFDCTRPPALRRKVSSSR